jgi:hypothetical protein
MCNRSRKRVRELIPQPRGANPSNFSVPKGQFVRRPLSLVCSASRLLHHGHCFSSRISNMLSCSLYATGETIRWPIRQFLQNSCTTCSTLQAVPRLLWLLINDTITRVHSGTNLPLLRQWRLFSDLPFQYTARRIASALGHIFTARIRAAGTSPAFQAFPTTSKPQIQPTHYFPFSIRNACFASPILVFMQMTLLYYLQSAMCDLQHTVNQPQTSEPIRNHNHKSNYRQ